MNKNSRFIFILLTKFSKRDSQRFGCDIIQKRGHDVEVWGCSSLLNTEYRINYNVPDPIDFPGLKEFKTLGAIKDALSDIGEKDIVIDNFNLLNDLEIESINGAKLLKNFCGEIPNFREYLNLGQKIIMYLSLRFQKKNKKKIIKNKFKKLFNTKRSSLSPNFIITGGRKAEDSLPYIDENSTKIVRAHAFDYDRYLEENNDSNFNSFSSNESYAVFIDSYICFHPDFMLTEENPHCKQEKYYPEINNFFNHFSEQNQLKVVIAIHPRSDFNLQEKLFQGREIIRNNVASVVKKAEVVLTHSSTAISFAVIYNKPLLLIDSDNYTKQFRYRTKPYEKYLGARTINISQNNFANINDIIVDKEKYKYFQEKYIKVSGTPNKLVWEIVCDYLDNLSDVN